MAKFRYRMQNILEVKEKLESQEKAAFSAANARLQEEKEKLEQLMLRRAGYERRLKELTVGQLDLREIQICKQSIDGMKVLIRDQMLAVQREQRNVNIARQRLDNAQKERKTHEKLKEKAFEEFLQELNAEEMKQIDQLVSYTYGRKSLEDEDQK